MSVLTLYVVLTKIVTKIIHTNRGPLNGKFMVLFSVLMRSIDENYYINI